jgi:putative methionine-R-sulfoxide reductase with GAF domain
MSSHFPAPDFTDKAAGYRELDAQLGALLAGERDAIANLANTSALLYAALPQLNWAGFYLLHPASQGGADGGSGELVLGPFQGKPACVRIALGRGVCGTAAAERRTQLVPDVHAFPGHIAVTTPCVCTGSSNVLSGPYSRSRFSGRTGNVNGSITDSFSTVCSPGAYRFTPITCRR